MGRVVTDPGTRNQSVGLVAETAWGTRKWSAGLAGKRQPRGTRKQSVTLVGNRLPGSLESRASWVEGAIG